MPRRRLNLKVLNSAPCTQPWSGMQGNERERHCAACDKQVHNFAAMTAREVEQLVRDKEGRLCARVTYREDGSICTLDGHSQPSLAAGIALAASLALGSSAAAETLAGTPEGAKARLTGTVLVPDGSGPKAGAVVLLRSVEEVIALARTDAQGNFIISTQPGRYDITIGPNVLLGVHIHAADLHEGEQSLEPVRISYLPDRDYSVETSTGGALVSTYKYPISYLFKHPLRYLKHLPHNFS